jgi:RNA-directed DNA polymerase
VETARAVEIDQGGLRQLLLQRFPQAVWKSLRKKRSGFPTVTHSDGGEIYLIKINIPRHKIQATPLEPISEADLEPQAYGYRPRRSAQEAIRQVHKLLCEGYREVVDADLSKYFDTIPHRELLKSVARRVMDRDLLRLVKRWLKVPVEERDEQGRRRMGGGKGQSRGTPQGGEITP